MGRHLSQKEKIKLCGELVERDGGYKCFYCKKPFDLKNRPIIEHLNDKWDDNRLDNHVLSCQSCNIKKVTDPILQELSYDKLDRNEMRIYVGERNFKRITKSKEQEIQTEIDINTKNYDLVHDYIKSRVESWDSVEFKDVLNSCVYLCKEKIGHGSHQCVRNYISSLTSSVSPYELVKEGKKKVIVLRAK